VVGGLSLEQSGRSMTFALQGQGELHGTSDQFGCLYLGLSVWVTYTNKLVTNFTAGSGIVNFRDFISFLRPVRSGLECIKTWS
jgi:hypothetical protein